MKFLPHINSILFVFIFALISLGDTFVDLSFSFLNEIVLFSFLLLISLNFTRLKYDFGSLIFIIPAIIFCLLSLISANNLHAGGYNTAIFIILILILFSIHGIRFSDKLLNTLIFLFTTGVLVGSWFFIENSYSELLGFDKESGIFINSNSFGMFLAFMIAFAMLSFKKSIYKFIYVAILMLFLLYSNSRGSLMFISIFLALYFIRSSTSTNRLFLNVIFGSIFVIFTFFTINSFIAETDIRIINKIQNSGTSGRFDIWVQIISKMLKDIIHIFFGSGPSTTLIDGKSAHNSFINESSNLGIFFVLFYSFLIFYKYVKYQLVKYSDFSLIVIPILFLGMVESVLFVNSLLWLLLLFLNLKYNSEKIADD